MKTASIGSLCRDYYIEYGKELNANRALPWLLDGLKPSYRRAIYIALQAPGNHIKSLDFIGKLQAIHPHGDKSIIGVENKLVRAGIFKPLGNFGKYPLFGESMQPAAPRYTSTGVVDKWHDILSPFISYVPYIDGEVEGVVEPEYIPTCLPLSLIIGSQGIGMGINSNIPNFSPKSLLEAYLTNDPSKLEPYYDLEIDKEKSDLNRLWNTGTGKVIYKYHMECGYDDSGRDGVHVWGATNMFHPNWTQILEWRSQGLVSVNDWVVGSTYHVFIARNKGVRKVTQDMIYEECAYCCSTEGVFEEIQTIYRLGIHDRKIARYISIKDWVDITYNNYLNLIEKYKSDNLSKCDFDEQVVLWMKPVVEILQNKENKPEWEDIDNQGIAEHLGISIEVVAAITRKSINSLRRKDIDSELSKIEERRMHYKAIKSKLFVKEIVDKM